jgi:hypothetical protein
MTAALAAIPSTKRISAGVRPADGATSRLPAWWGATDWLEVEVPAALEEHPEILSEIHVSTHAVVAVARAMAGFANYRTGRDCRPTNARLLELLDYSLSTIQRARRALKRLGLVAVLVKGRSIMSRSERLEAWARGSSHRNVAAEFALLSKPRRAPKKGATQVRNALGSGSAGAQPVERDTPPGASRVERVSHLSRSLLRRRTENEERLRRTHNGVAPSARRLAEAVVARFLWLRGASWRRIAPTLARFARAGWTARDVDLAVRDVLTRRGHVVPRDLKVPAAFLANVLRDLDPADRPTAVEDQARELERREERYRLQLATGAPCAHGRPAGDVPSPTRGLLACPACRLAAEPAGW